MTNKKQISKANKIKFIMLVKDVNMGALIKLLIGSKIQVYLGDTVGSRAP